MLVTGTVSLGAGFDDAARGYIMALVQDTGCRGYRSDALST